MGVGGCHGDATKVKWREQMREGERAGEVYQIIRIEIQKYLHNHDIPF